MAEENGSTKKHQWTVTFAYQKDGITVSENYTERNDDWEELTKYKNVILGHLPSTQAFPNDSGPVATPPAQVVQGLGNCPNCGAPLKWSVKKSKTYCSALCWKKGQV